MKDMYFTQNKGDFPDEVNLKLGKTEDLRYGENPNQPAAVYQHDSPLEFETIKTGKQGLSSTNLMDLTRAIDILKFFRKPACAVMKHAIPSGFSTNDVLLAAYRNARDADYRASFGSVVVFNQKLDYDTASEINKTFVECVSAPSFEKEAVDLLSKKKNLRIISFNGIEKLPKFEGDKTATELRTLPGGRIIAQKPFLTRIRDVDCFENAQAEGLTVAVKAGEDQLNDLLTAWYVNIGTRSNGIVIVRNGTTLAIGSGQQERVGAVEQAVIKAYQKAMEREGTGYEPLRVMESLHKLPGNPLEGAVVSSDGFFPFRDSVELLAKQGIKAIVQPGGSLRDADVIKAVNEQSMAMLFTNERCFGHF